jgi:hypothetical protein
MHLVQVPPNKPYPNQRALLVKKSECIRSLFDNMIFHPEILRAGKIKKNPSVLRYQKQLQTRDRSATDPQKEIRSGQQQEASDTFSQSLASMI